ncbi:MAG: DUF853 domain-containing protein [Lachnospiraceae bacterium]|nr:DUF853 domain-containing protein [Lachnospiraceae bacterium]
MFYEGKIWVGTAGEKKVSILPEMANRHGLIAGATGTGKTVTLKVLAESFSDAGVPVFLADVKGDLSGMCRKGKDSEDMQERINRFGLEDAGFSYKDYPTAFWDIYGENGISLRTTVSEMGPILLAKLMDLNDTQADILTCLFKMADDEELLLVDIKDLKAMLQYASDHCSEISKNYGNVTKASVASIIRGVVALEASGGDQFFTEPGFNIKDFLRTEDGRGMINILDGTKLASDPRLYTAFLLYLLSELFESLPEVGDADKPKLVFFFDEAHLLFDDISKSLRQKIEQIVKLIRSKGVGVYFCTQNPRDIPDEVLAQLGNKIQHALHAYTPAEERAVKTAADSFRSNPDFDTKTAIMELGVGEALISVLDEEGVPTIVERCRVLPPASLIGPADDDDKRDIYKADAFYKKYKDPIETDSAYEFLERLKSQQEEKRAEEEKKAADEKKAAEEAKEKERADREAAKIKEREEREAAREAEKEAKAAEREEAAKKRKFKSAAGSVASTTAGTIGREIGKSLGGKVGGKYGKTLGGNIFAQLGRSIMGTFFK